MARSECQQK